MPPTSPHVYLAPGLALAAALALFPNTASADKPLVGLGGGLGDPTGPSLKIFFHDRHALQIDLGWAPMHHGHGIVHANYLFHFAPFISNSTLDFGLYLGVGAGMTAWAGRRFGYAYNHGGGYYGRGSCNNNGNNGNNCDCGRGDCRYRGGGVAMNVRVPFGIYVHWQKIPIDTVLEGGWSPYVIYPDLFHGDLSVKTRYYF